MANFPRNPYEDERDEPARPLSRHPDGTTQVPTAERLQQQLERAEAATRAAAKAKGK